MNNNTIQITIDDYFKTVVGIIANDLLINKHLYYLRQSGLDTTPIYLRLHEHIFSLLGIQENENNSPLIEWYFEQAEKANHIGTFNSQKQLYDLSANIMNGLIKARDKGTGE